MPFDRRKPLNAALRIRKPIFRVVPVLFLFGVLLGVARFAAQPCHAAEGARVIRAGSELDFRPYSYTDKDGQPTGFAVELLKAVADKMGLRIRITSGPWNQVWDGLVAGQLDVLPVVARTPGREPLVDFSMPHTETFDAFFVQEGRPMFPDLAAAAGKEIVVLRSDAAHHELVERKFAAKVIPVESIPDGLRRIAAGRHDAFLCSKLVGVLELEQAGIKGVASGPPIPDYKRLFSFAVKKGDAELLEKLNQGLLIVKTGGEYDRIYRKWLSAEDPWRKYEKYLLPVGAGASAVGLAVAIWLAMLRRMVKARTAELDMRNEMLRRSSEERMRSEEEVRKLNIELEQRVIARTNELRESEERTRERNMVLDGIGRILHLALTSETEEELGRACLAVAEEVTRSKFGFIGEIGPDGRLHDLAISDPGWELCTMYDKTGHRRPPGDFRLHGLYGKVILDGKGFFTNDPHSHPDSIGTPEGHPRLSAFLGAPLIKGGKTIGMVAMGNRENGYRREDLDALTALADAMVQALLRKRAEEALRALVAEKETLLKELAHRTKNNLQVVGSLLSLQAVSSADKKLLDALADIQDRIRAMALVHERLYRSGNFASLNMRDYVTDLMTSLLQARQGVGGPVRTELDLEDIFTSIDAALPCGLIISELVSNSLKHAFRDREAGAVFLSLRRAGEKIELTYRDDGPGLPRDLDLSRTRSLGLKLVYNLAVRQLRGAMEIRRDPVSEFVITFDGLARRERA